MHEYVSADVLEAVCVVLSMICYALLSCKPFELYFNYTYKVVANANISQTFVAL